MVEKFGMAQAKPVSTPMEPGVQFSVDKCLSSANQVARIRGVLYIQAIGSVLWPLTDNEGAIALAKDNKFHARTKHIDLRYYFICEAVEYGKIQVKYVLMDDNVSDIFTKPLPRPKFTKFMESLGLRRSDGTKAKHRY